MQDNSGRQIRREIKGGKLGEKVGKKVGEMTGEKVGESLGEINKLNLCPSVQAILKAMIATGFLGPNLGGVTSSSDSKGPFLEPNLIHMAHKLWKSLWLNFTW